MPIYARNVGDIQGLRRTRIRVGTNWYFAERDRGFQVAGAFAFGPTVFTRG